ncbi:GNAT family N-acetyltransferase [Emticicia fluvialis]|uniref:GNAT family N-acetyltransferase n=1 Tax=Emticicia fluvialis TaxID=2974474 RepID=UPI002165D6ED|nr:GNAT family N-acetyltransferase [Emticicia fluvialis]
MLKSSRLNFLKINESCVDLFTDAQFTYPVMKYITGHALTKEEAIERYLKFTDEPIAGNYFVLDAASGQTIGLAKLAVESPGVVEIGYSLFEDYWGKGLASEMAQALMDYALETLKPEKIIGFVDSRNRASVRILEKVGLTLESEVKERQGGNVWLFSKTIAY